MDFVIELLSATMRLATPIALAAMGAAVCERSGIINIAMEGLMLMGAFFAAAIALATGSPWLGLLGGVVFGGLFSLLHAWSTVTLHIDHTVSGAIINILAAGLTRFFMVQFYGHPGSSDMVEKTLGDINCAIPLLSKIPVVGPVLFDQSPTVYFMYFFVFFTTFLLKRTKLGLHIRAAGEHPMALETLGISVKKIRYFGVLYSGLLCGFAGSFLAIEYGRFFTEGMTGGRGFIALAANVSGGWTALGSFLAALFFGFIDALQLKLQVMDAFNIPPEVFHILPYAATVIAVAGLVKRSRPPADSGNDFSIEKEM
jgi:general nucleoside transport system permease protein